MIRNNEGDVRGFKRMRLGEVRLERKGERSGVLGKEWQIKATD